MAMHRRVTLPNLPSAAFVPGRAHNALDQERQDFERNQVNAVLKSLTLDESAPKEKHVRTLIMGTFVAHGGSVFWRNIKDYASLHGNEVVCWKFLIILYRILQDGQANSIRDSLEEMPFIDAMSKYHINSKSELASYGRLANKFGRLILTKLMFHRKYPEIPGNMILKEVTLSTFDAAKNFELCVDFLDLLESIIQLKVIVLDTFTPTKALSMTHSGQCRLSAIIPCTHESSRIIEIVGKMLRILHRALPWDTLDGHRQRFVSLYKDLSKIYEKLSNIQYLRGIIQVPVLSSDLSHFLGSLHRLQEDVQVAEDPHSYEEEDGGKSGVEDLITVSETASADAYSLAYIQGEYSELSSKYQNVLLLLQEEKKFREGCEHELQNRTHQFQAEVETLKKQHELALAVAAASASAALTHSDESAKLEKLKTVYQKLRQDHITLLRQKGDLEKEKREVQATLTSSERKCADLESSIRTFLERAQIQAGDDLAARLIGAAERMHQLSQLVAEKDEQLDILRASREADLAAVSTDNAVAMANLSAEVDQLRKETTNLTSALSKKESEADQLRAKWRNQVFKILSLFAREIKKLEASELPTMETIFADLTDPYQLSKNLSNNNDDDRLVTTSDLVFYSMMSLLALQPFANADTFDMKSMVGSTAEILTHLTSGDNFDGLDSSWSRLLTETSSKMSFIRGIKWDPSDVVDREIYEMQSRIDEAAAALEKLLMEAKANEQKKANIDVDMKILDSCSQLFAAIQEVIKNGRKLQNEITSEAASSGTASKPEFYRKNLKWTEGLISASKDIGRGAKLLVESANAVVNEKGRFEEIIAASQEIASSTAQLVVASKVKARSDSQNLASLSSASKKVAEATGHVIATTRSCYSAADNETVDLDTLSVHQTKRLEMEIQIKVLELESHLEKERHKLFALRKKQYAASANNNSNGVSEENPKQETTAE